MTVRPQLTTLLKYLKTKTIWSKSDSPFNNTSVLPLYELTKSTSSRLNDIYSYLQILKWPQRIIDKFFLKIQKHTLLSPRVCNDPFWLFHHICGSLILFLLFYISCSWDYHYQYYKSIHSVYKISTTNNFKHLPNMRKIQHLFLVRIG